jgi:hypothetical protein
MFKHFLFITALMAILVSCKQIKSHKESVDWKGKGDSLVVKTFDTLRSTLLRAINQNDFPGAVEFCNTEALQLTKSLAADGIQIKRSSDKIRNPANNPDELENEVLHNYLKQKEDKKLLAAIIKKDASGNQHYFKPIMIQAMCLNCHGEKNTHIKPATWDMIQRKYPRDAAFNYKEGDLRGIWHIVFPSDKSGL